jgi:hypothetical protein
VIAKAIFLHLQAKVPARRNISDPLKIHFKPSTDDSDFAQPPSKRNRGPEQEPCNIPRQPLQPTEAQPDREAPAKKTDK